MMYVVLGEVGKAVSKVLPHLGVMEVLIFSTIRKVGDDDPKEGADTCTLDIYNDKKGQPALKIPIDGKFACHGQLAGSQNKLHPLATTSCEGRYGLYAQFVLVAGWCWL